jgi:hypothetical protein
MLWAVVTFAVLGGLTYVGYSMEPHWVSKDGSRMMCVGQLLDEQHQPIGRWREVRAARLPDGAWHVSQRRRIAARSLPGEYWTVEGEMPSPKSKRTQFVLRGRDSSGAATTLILRIPSSSRAVALLNESAGLASP